MGSQSLHGHRCFFRANHDCVQVRRRLSDRNEFPLRFGDVYQVVRRDREGQVTRCYTFRYDHRGARWWNLVYYRNRGSPE